MVELSDNQLAAVNKLSNGNILCGGVGSGKSRTSLAYFYIKECKGQIVINGKGNYKDPKKPKDLYIITTARKRDTLEWSDEAIPFNLPNDKINVTVDSWNNINKYTKVKDAFFIFDEQRVSGSGAWVSAFIKISKANRWILLTATPGDTWMDYIPVFIANGFYKNRTEFIRNHVIFNRFCKYPKVERYINCDKLAKHKREITVVMKYTRINDKKHIYLRCDYSKELMNIVEKERWDPFNNKPFQDVSGMCYAMRRVCNSDVSRMRNLVNIINKKHKAIIFYNFNYERDVLRSFNNYTDHKVEIAEWNGDRHEPVPTGDRWIYLVQYNSGAEGWNCTSTDTLIFFSQNYSYKMMTQAAGRIDRMNTPYKMLYYYHLVSDSNIDKAIFKTLSDKKDFNERDYILL